MWIGSDKEVNEWLPQNAVAMTSTKINFNVERFYKCNVFVHQAKIHPGIDKSGLSDPKLVITANGRHEKTKVIMTQYKTTLDKLTNCYARRL